MMITSYANQPNLNVSSFKYFKYLIIIVVFTWGASQAIGVLDSSSNISAHGQYTPLRFPRTYNLTLSRPGGENLQMKSQWRFRVQNEGHYRAYHLAFQLPFDGFYTIERTGKESSKLLDFQRKIEIESIDPQEEVYVFVWTDSEVNPKLENRTSLTHNGSVVSIAYPVIVEGFLAWVNRYKNFLAAMVVLLLICLL